MPNRCYADLIAGGWKRMTFGPFRDGVDICWLERGASDLDPSVALLKYAPGATVPRHRHRGLETVIVLEGAQGDENGVYRAGAVVLNPEGSEHSVSSPEGCVVLINWTRPVLILEDRA